jgi:hypothetical protein
MNRFALIIFVATSFVANTKGQGVKIKESKFYNITEIGYGVGVGKINFEDVNIKVDNSSKYFRLRTQFGYMLSEKFSLGLGVGLDGYHEYTFNTAPLFIDARYYLKNQPQTFFIFSNLGYAIPLANNFEKGFMGGIALGRKISTKRLIVLPSIGLNVQQLQDISYYAPSTGSNHGDNIQLMSVQLNLGLMF